MPFWPFHLNFKQSLKIEFSLFCNLSTSSAHVAPQGIQSKERGREGGGGERERGERESWLLSFFSFSENVSGPIPISPLRSTTTALNRQSSIHTCCLKSQCACSMLFVLSLGMWWQNQVEHLIGVTHYLWSSSRQHFIHDRSCWTQCWPQDTKQCRHYLLFSNC